MAQFSAVFWFEAETLDEAQGIVGEWTVTPGTTLGHIQGTVSTEGPPVEVPESGSVGEAMAAVSDREAPPE